MGHVPPERGRTGHRDNEARNSSTYLGAARPPPEPPVGGGRCPVRASRPWCDDGCLTAAAILQTYLSLPNSWARDPAKRSVPNTARRRRQNRQRRREGHDESYGFGAYGFTYDFGAYGLTYGFGAYGFTDGAGA